MEKAGLSDQAPATPKTFERMRRFCRYPFDVRIEVRVFRGGLTTTYWGRTNEIGQDGVGATLSGALQTDEVVSVEFPIPLPPLVMKLRALVRYSDGLRCGFEFLVMTEEQRQTLHQLGVVLSNAL